MTECKHAINAHQLRAFCSHVLDPSAGSLEFRAFGSDFDGNKNLVAGERYSKTIGGWFDNVDSLIDKAAGRLRGISGYVTINPGNPALFSRAKNRLVVFKKDAGLATRDTDILFHRWLYIDCDSVRPDGISATQEEWGRSIELRDRVLDGEPILRSSAIWGSSGNGGWILVRLPDLPNDKETYGLLGRILGGLAEKYGKKGRPGDLAFIDEKTKNASRVMCLPGTLKCKGEDDEANGRPWRPVTIDGGAGL
jgi:hypothetical protein